MVDSINHNEWLHMAAKDIRSAYSQIQMLSKKPFILALYARRFD